MKLNTKNGILDVKATRTDSAGNGYYRASDGYYYYGNAQNGYLTETEETRRLKAAQNSSSHSQSGSYSGRSASAGGFGTGNPILDVLAFKAGSKLGEWLASFIMTVIPFLVKVLLVFGLLPEMAMEYMHTFIAYNDQIGIKLLSILGFVAIIAMVVYGVYRRIKGQKSIAKPVFIVETLALTGICYLNIRSEEGEMAIVLSIVIALVAAYSVKVMSAWLEKLVYNIWKKAHSKK